MTLLAASLPFILSRVRSAGELAAIAGIAVAIAAAMMLWTRWQQYRTRRWPTSIGTIASLDVRKVDGGLNGIDYWKVTIGYTYTVQQEHQGSYSFNCTSEQMGQGAVAGLTDKPVCVHYSPSNESKSLLWEREIWDLWWDTYWQLANGDAVTG